MRQKKNLQIRLVEAPVGEMVLRYQSSGEGLREIIERLSPAVYRYPSGKAYSQEDDAGEFYLYFYPRLLRLLTRYRDRGVPFEHYFHSVLYWNWKSYRRRWKKSEQRWRAAARREFWNGSEENRENPDSSGWGQGSKDGWEALFRIDESGMIAGASARRRFLFLSLRFSAALSPDDIARIAALTGYGAGWIAEKVSILKNRLASREKRLRGLRERRNWALYRRILLQDDFLREPIPEGRRELQKRIRKLEERSALAAREISRIPRFPTHQAIADVLAVPKGTVDTGLRWCKKRWDQVCLSNGHTAGNQQLS
jgi:hypothetical protein